MDLRVGEVYFIVLCVDEDLRIPVIQTLIYTGERVRDNGEAFLSFRDLSSQDEESMFSVERQFAEDLLVDRTGLISRLKEYLI